ncbi:hypothetical protein [Saccharothrix syringae]|nr:hypothetical protein [Saccharothrix syringae]
MVVLALLAVVCSACSSEPPPPPVAPAIPTILPATTVTRAPQMVDRDLPDDCELIVPVDVLHARLGRELPGELKQVIGIPEPSIGRTAKIDCYYGVERQVLLTAPVVVGLAKYTDEATAANRVAESVDAERREGASVSQVDVGRQKASLVVTKDERLLVGSLGKTTFVSRAKAGVAPDEAVGAFLAAVAQQSMTPVEDA